jgi:transcriptional regulator with XRE-family HTH domain
MSETLEDIAPPRVTPVRQNGLVIRVLREKDGWSQTQLAEAIGITQPALSLIESESNGVEAFRLPVIARLLDVPVAAISSRAAVPCAVCAAREAAA